MSNVEGPALFNYLAINSKILHSHSKSILFSLYHHLTTVYSSYCGCKNPPTLPQVTNTSTCPDKVEKLTRQLRKKQNCHQLRMKCALFMDKANVDIIRHWVVIEEGRPESLLEGLLFALVQRIRIIRTNTHHDERQVACVGFSLGGANLRRDQRTTRQR